MKSILIFGMINNRVAMMQLTEHTQIANEGSNEMVAVTCTKKFVLYRCFLLPLLLEILVNWTPSWIVSNVE